jgi:hypothetical protein
MLQCDVDTLKINVLQIALDTGNAGFVEAVLKWRGPDKEWFDLRQCRFFGPALRKASGDWQALFDLLVAWRGPQGQYLDLSLTSEVLRFATRSVDPSALRRVLGWRGQSGEFINPYMESTSSLIAAAKEGKVEVVQQILDWKEPGVTSLDVRAMSGFFPMSFLGLAKCARNREMARQALGFGVQDCSSVDRFDEKLSERLSYDLDSLQVLLDHRGEHGEFYDPRERYDNDLVGLFNGLKITAPRGTRDFTLVRCLAGWRGPNGEMFSLTKAYAEAVPGKDPTSKHFAELCREEMMVRSEWRPLRAAWVGAVVLAACAGQTKPAHEP